MMIRRGLLNTCGRGTDKYKETGLISYYNMSSTVDGTSYNALPQTIDMADGDYIKVDLRGIKKPTGVRYIFTLSYNKNAINYIVVRSYYNGGKYYLSIFDKESNIIAKFDEATFPANMSFLVRYVGGFVNIEDLMVNDVPFIATANTVATSNVRISHFGLNEHQLYASNYLGITYGKKL